MASEAWGTKFILVNDVQQPLPPKIFQGGPWIHMATVVRGLREYMCFKHQPSGKIYIEIVNPKNPALLEKITDEVEFEDLHGFLRMHGVLEVGAGKEFKVAKKK